MWWPKIFSLNMCIMTIEIQYAQKDIAIFRLADICHLWLLRRYGTGRRALR